ncbi:glycosyltransferase family 2 protein [Zunongwangia profunda]|jgi:glycosyltransferase involved in cell wall biosynthesis|uniref:glycosyltransferase family 2 protein n=1 Tax=Zunongwangia profunda TaxID=398743 RepID=UPI001D18139A|nr:glycosyltransferase [Zunongwangia profunda]MCC4230164.1 glycosyltransferase [Zunongwangia profunda]|tara:strand:+ start:7868 stop:8701 length:834 start_codon:yes stop_codon:yes gene_type:complete
MNYNPKLSIIIPCFNDLKFIENAVKYANIQTYDNKEIIVVDDGSNLETKKVLKNLETKIDNLITQKNSGAGAARNTGIKEANGDFILVWDADDYFEPEFAIKAIEIFKKNNGVKVVTCWARWFKENNEHQIFKPSGGKLKDFLLHNAAIGTSMFKKKDWQIVGGYDEKMSGFEDWEFYIRLHENGGHTMVIPEVLFHYRKKKNSRNDYANSIKYQLLEYIYIKHQNSYCENFQTFVKFFLQQSAILENTIRKRENSLDFKIGRIVLKPIRFIKKMFF